MTGKSNARNYTQFGLLRAGERTFGNHLKEAGYTTCIAGKWQLSGDANTTEKGSWWTDCGFDESCMWAYSHYLKKADQEHYETHSIFGDRKASRFWNPCILENGTYRPTTEQDFGPDIYTEFVLDFIERKKDAPFFVYFPMALTHSPFVPTPHTQDFPLEDKTKSKPKYFGDMIRYTGFLVNRIVKKLEETQIAEETLLIFTTDNGTGRGLVSYLGTRLIPGGKALPIDAGCHVPLIAHWPGTIQPGSVCHDLIDFSDFLPTLLDAAKIPLPAEETLDGRSFLAQLKGQKGNPRNEVLVHYDKDPGSPSPKFRRVRFAYDGRYKLYDDGRFFDVHQDWDEETPLSEEHLSRPLKQTRDRLQGSFDRLPSWTPDNSTFQGQPDDETKKRLILRDRILSQAK